MFRTPLKFSPHTWRCFSGIELNKRKVQVFSTYVEVFLKPIKKTEDRLSFLHIRGGVSIDPAKVTGID